jgi:acid phosphatase type 7
VRPTRRGGAIPLAVAALVALTACEGAGESEPSAAPSATPPTSPPSASPEPSNGPKEDEILIVAVGDIVCDTESAGFDGRDPRVCQHRATAKLVPPADAVLVLGDLQYEVGSLEAFRLLYDPTWGRFADITFPTPGNHDYETPGGEGYFEYWRSKDRPTGGAGHAFYGFDLGPWHVISLDSNCFSCAEGSAQDRFLERDLARTNAECILAFWHHPYFNSGAVHEDDALAVVHGFWADLYAAGADIVLNGHEHNYQRYAKQDPSGHVSPRGIREFVVGTGGRSLYPLREDPERNLHASDATYFGVLRLSLGEDSYSWEFVSTGGAVLDRGGPTRCN